jgi:putative transposase
MAKKNTTDFPKELLDQLLAGRDSKTALDSSGLIGDLKKVLAERMLNAEMNVHLAKEAEVVVANHRNGTSDKTVLTLRCVFRPLSASDSAVCGPGIPQHVGPLFKVI